MAFILSDPSTVGTLPYTLYNSPMVQREAGISAVECRTGWWKEKRADQLYFSEAIASEVQTLQNLRSSKLCIIRDRVVRDRLPWAPTPCGTPVFGYISPARKDKNGYQRIHDPIRELKRRNGIKATFLGSHFKQWRSAE